MARIVPWSELGSLEGVAALVGDSSLQLASWIAGMPEGVTGRAVVAGDALRAVGLWVDVDFERDGSLSLARLACAPGGLDDAMLLVDALEAWGVERGARRLGVSVLRVEGMEDRLALRGFAPKNAMIRMHPRHAGAPEPLPRGMVERGLDEVGLRAWMEIANAAFAHVDFGTQSTLEDFERLVATEGFDASLVRFLCDGDGPVAYCQATRHGDAGEVEAIGTAARARGRGFGKWALRRAIALLEAAGAAPIWLSVAETNEAARGLYAAEGWVEVSRTRVWSRETASASGRPAVTVEEGLPPDVRARVSDGLTGFNTAATGDGQFHRFAAVARAPSGAVAGAAVGLAFWGWLHVESLWVDEANRGTGLGRELLAAPEAEAGRRGCQHAHVDTFSFQAPGFYERCGYGAFGELAAFPAPHRRIYLQKRL